MSCLRIESGPNGMNLETWAHKMAKIHKIGSLVGLLLGFFVFIFYVILLHVFSFNMFLFMMISFIHLSLTYILCIGLRMESVTLLYVWIIYAVLAAFGFLIMAIVIPTRIFLMDSFCLHIIHVSAYTFIAAFNIYSAMSVYSLIRQYLDSPQLPPRVRQEETQTEEKVMEEKPPHHSIYM